HVHHSPPPSFPTRRSSDLIAFDLPTAEEITFEETPVIAFDEPEPAPAIEEPPVFEEFSFEPQAPTSEEIGEVDFYIEQELLEERSEEHTSELQSLRHLVCR